MDLKYLEGEFQRIEEEEREERKFASNEIGQDLER